MSPLLCAIPLALCSAWTLLGLAATVRVRLGRVPLEGDAPVTILKPLAGADADLAENLASFFEQDRQAIEVVLGVTRADDPAVAIAEGVRARYPHVPSKLVVHDGRQGLNPKVANLLGMLPAATHDLVLVSDSNVRAPRHAVREMVRVALAGATTTPPEAPGLVTHLFAGAGEDGVGSALESVQLAGFCAGGMAFPTLLGDALVVGKSMMFSRRVLGELGGLERVADVLAEDFILGKMFQHAGRPVRIAPTILANVTRGTRVTGFLDRQLRWAMIRSRLRPAAQTLEVVTSPLALLPFAVSLFGLGGGLAWALAALWLRDVGGWLALRGPTRAWIPLALAPLRELMMLGVWVRAPFKRHVVWRGHRVRVGMGTFGYRAAPERSRSLSGGTRGS